MCAGPSGPMPWCNSARGQRRLLWNPVGLQTNLKGEQKRVLQLIPGLENASFVRFGVMHRNTFFKSPSCSSQPCNSASAPAPGGRANHRHRGPRRRRRWRLARRTNAARLARGEAPSTWSATTMAGPDPLHQRSLSGKFQPMPPLGLLLELPERIRDKRRRYGATAIGPWPTCPTARPLRSPKPLQRPRSSSPNWDVIVIGAGIGGLHATTGGQRYKVLVLERYLIPGGSGGSFASRLAPLMGASMIFGFGEKGTPTCSPGPSLMWRALRDHPRSSPAGIPPARRPEGRGSRLRELERLGVRLPATGIRAFYDTCWQVFRCLDAMPLLSLEDPAYLAMFFRLHWLAQALPAGCPSTLAMWPASTSTIPNCSSSLTWRLLLVGDASGSHPDDQCRHGVFRLPCRRHQLPQRRRWHDCANWRAASSATARYRRGPRHARAHGWQSAVG